MFKSVLLGEKYISQNAPFLSTQFNDLKKDTNIAITAVPFSNQALAISPESSSFFVCLFVFIKNSFWKATSVCLHVLITAGLPVSPNFLTNRIYSISSCAYLPCVSLLWINVYSDALPVYSLAHLSFYCWVVTVLYIFWMQMSPLSDILFENIFSHFWVTFLFFMKLFTV